MISFSICTQNPQTPSLFAIAIRPSNPVLLIRSNEQRSRLGRRCEPTLRTNLRPISPKDDGDRYEEERDAAEERAGPIHAERVEHVGCEEGEDGAEEGAQEGVCCYG